MPDKPARAAVATVSPWSFRKVSKAAAFLAATAAYSSPPVEIHSTSRADPTTSCHFTRSSALKPSFFSCSSVLPLAKLVRGNLPSSKQNRFCRT